mmetsp:Transcript_36842/g.78338  ORF Transcript_36842/g.78338 Transcript_36842/m.78338 type:complete len:142 (-) Transcript_36842:137-562(-)
MWGKAKGAGKTQQRDSPYGKGAGKSAAGKGKGKAAEPEREEVDDSLKVWVGNLSFRTQWQEVKDFMGQVGEVQHVKIFMKDGKGKGKGWGKGKGKSRGQGVVTFSSAEEAESAIASLNGAELEGREIVVDTWTTGWTKDAE